jgi:hypothetical protein
VPRATVEPVLAGATALPVHPWAGLDPAGGDVIQVGPSPVRERELAITLPFSPPGDPLAPAMVPLSAPLTFAHARRTAVSLAAVAAAAVTTVAREAQPGDEVLFGSNLTAVATDSVLRVEGATPRAELRFARRPPVYSGGSFRHRVTVESDGTFVLPPLARIAQLRLEAEHAGQGPFPSLDFAPDYECDNSLQVLFTP